MQSATKLVITIHRSADNHMRAVITRTKQKGIVLDVVDGQLENAVDKLGQTIKDLVRSLAPSATLD